MFGVLGVSYFLRNVNDSSSFLFDGFEGPCCYCDVIGLLEWVECKYYGNQLSLIDGLQAFAQECVWFILGLDGCVSE